MNRKGFTLVELIVTIALLSIISLISFVSINKAIQKSKNENCNSIINSIKSAASIYFSDKKYELSSAEYNGYKKVSDFYSSGYLTSTKVSDPYTSEEIDISNIKVNKNGKVQGNIYTDTWKECKKY